MGLLLTLILVMLLLGAMPTWPYSRTWGYGPSGVASALLIVLIVLMLFSVLDPWTFGPPVVIHRP